MSKSWSGWMSWGLGIAIVTSFSSSSSSSSAAEIPVGESAAQLPASEVQEKESTALTFGANYKADFGSAVRGGLKKGSVFLGNLTLDSDIDLERLAGLKGTEVFIQILANHGKALTESVGDIQASSNIEGPASVRLFQAGLKKTFYEDRASILLGLHDLASEFNVTESSLTLLNSGFAVNPELAQSGRAGPSIFPTSGLAAVVVGQPSSFLQLRAGLYDGAPDVADSHRFARAKISREEGGLVIGEVAGKFSLRAQPGSAGLGYWRYTRNQAHLSAMDDEGNAKGVPSSGIYGLLNQRIYSEVEGRDQGLSAFLRGGAAFGESVAISHSVSWGLSYLGLVSSRSEDMASIGASLARSSRASYEAQEKEPGSEVHRWETALEVTYRYQARKWLALQPDLQWIIHPGFAPGVSNALVASTRVELAL